MTLDASPSNSPLGKTLVSPDGYDPSILFPMPRATKRAELGITAALPFFGMDIWNAYEVSWLNLRGKPQVAILSLQVPADSPNIIESKSLKLYLNGLNQCRLAGSEAVLNLLRADLSAGFGAPLQIRLTEASDFQDIAIGQLEGLLLDRLDIEMASYDPSPSHLVANTSDAPVEEKLVSHLLKTNCLVTGQPDWASIQIHYVGAQIQQEGLLKYLIGFRFHQEFHEQCVERIFMDILRQCRPQKLMVLARYTRRGGIDINPWRSNFSMAQQPPNIRLARQ